MSHTDNNHEHEYVYGSNYCQVKDCTHYKRPDDTELVEAEIVTEQTLSSLIYENTLAVNAMRETLEHQVTLLGEIKDAVAPMLDKLGGSPMFRMMFPGGD